jgi:PAS domain-containing protein
MWDLHTLPTGAYFCDPEGWIRQANPEALRIWGLKESQLQSRRFCPAQKRLGPDGTELSIDQTPPARAVRLGKPVRNARILITRADSRLWVPPRRPGGCAKRTLNHAHPIYRRFLLALILIALVSYVLRYVLPAFIK